jgi:hypothetical protein
MARPITVAIGNTGLTALQALAEAEGTNSVAKLHRAEIIRRTENGHSDIFLDVLGIIQESANDSILITEDVDKQFEKLFAKQLADPVPEVNAADIKAAWRCMGRMEMNSVV